MTETEAIERANDAGFRIYKNNGRWHRAAKFWVDEDSGGSEPAAEAWEDICRAYPASIETMACKHMRTHGAIKSRLGHFDMIVWSGRGYRLCPVHTYDIPPRMRHTTKVLKAWGYEGTTVLTPPIGIYNREIAWL